MSLFRSFAGLSAASKVGLGLFLLLQGCAQHSPPAGEAAAQALSPAPGAGSSPLVAWVAAQPPDRYADTTLDDPAFGNNLAVRIESQYLSALGVPCRRARISVVVNGPPAETVAVCRDGGGTWFLAPRIWKGVVADQSR